MFIITFKTQTVWPGTEQVATLEETCTIFIAWCGKWFAEPTRQRQHTTQGLLLTSCCSFTSWSYTWQMPNKCWQKQTNVACTLKPKLQSPKKHTGCCCSALVSKIKPQSSCAALIQPAFCPTVPFFLKNLNNSIHVGPELQRSVPQDSSWQFYLTQQYPRD